MGGIICWCLVGITWETTMYNFSAHKFRSKQFLVSYYPIMLYGTFSFTHVKRGCEPEHFFFPFALKRYVYCVFVCLYIHGKRIFWGFFLLSFHYT